jgi:putative transcriptional regulator
LRFYLKFIRKGKGWSQQSVAQKLGISQTFYSMIERGERNPTLSLAKQIANLFGVDNIDELFFTKAM